MMECPEMTLVGEGAEAGRVAVIAVGACEEVGVMVKVLVEIAPPCPSATLKVKLSLEPPPELVTD